MVFSLVLGNRPPLEISYVLCKFHSHSGLYGGIVSNEAFGDHYPSFRSVGACRLIMLGVARLSF